MRYRYGENTTARSKYETDLKNKQNAFKDALEYATKYIGINDLEAFAKDMVGYFKTSFEQQHGEEFPRMLSTDKKIEMVGAEPHRLEAFQNAFNRSSIEIDLNTLEPINEAPDFGQYLRDEEQIKLYQKAQAVINAIGELEKSGVRFQKGLIRQMSNGLIGLNLAKNELVINVSNIQLRSK